MRRWFHWLFHSWVIVATKGAHDYWQCKICKERTVSDMPGIIGPVDWQWIDTGEWSTQGLPPRCGSPGNPQELSELNELLKKIAAQGKADT